MNFIAALIKWWENLSAALAEPVVLNPTGVVAIAPSGRPIATQPIARRPEVPLPDRDVTAVAKVILGYNNGLLIFKVLPIWTNPVKGSTIHKIDATQAMAVAEQIVRWSPFHNLPVTLTKANLAIESTFDPNAENRNIGPGESNVDTPNDAGGYDEGVAQLKLKELSDSLAGATLEQKMSFALDITRAIPYHCDDMSGLVATAKEIIAANTSSVPDPRLSNPYLLAACLYNFGRTGGKAIYESGQFPSHCQHVLDLEQSFAKQLGVPSCFA